VGVKVFGTTPGQAGQAVEELRPLTARFCIAVDCSVNARSPLFTWMSEDRRRTVTVSATAPIGRMKVDRP